MCYAFNRLARLYERHLNLKHKYAFKMTRVCVTQNNLKCHINLSDVYATDLNTNTPS